MRITFFVNVVLISIYYNHARATLDGTSPLVLLGQTRKDPSDMVKLLLQMFMLLSTDLQSL